MKNIAILTAVVFLILQGCKMKNTSTTVIKPVDSLFTDYYEEHLKIFPLDATMAGDNRYNDTLPDNLTASYRALLREFYTKYLNELAKYDTNSLSQEQKMSYNILHWECDINLEGLKYPTYLTPESYYWPACRGRRCPAFQNGKRL